VISHSVGAPLLGIDAFTGERFQGNPAAVCLLDGPVDDEWMQALAAEMNLSETAYVTPHDDGFGLRWFTPTTEVQLCGHATLASAHALWETGRLALEASARFHTRWKGVLGATRVEHGIALDLPAALSVAVAEPPGLRDALGADIVATVQNSLHHIAELADARTVRGLAPDIAKLSEVDVDALTVTARSDDDRYDFLSRHFAPKYGIDEDPVTGSAHTSLAPYWADKLGRLNLRAYQASARGGELRVELNGDRVSLIGRAITVWRGELT